MGQYQLAEWGQRVVGLGLLLMVAGAVGTRRGLRLTICALGLAMLLAGMAAYTDWFCITGYVAYDGRCAWE